MSKLYFKEGDEFATTIRAHKEYMEDNDIKEMELTEAKIETGTEYFYCSHFMEVGEVGQGCGKMCEAYAPRNGKSGRCKFSGNCYDYTDKKITIIV